MKKRRSKHYFSTEPGMPEPISVDVKRRLAFSEVDAMAIAWHGNYPRFFEAAHTELMQKIGLGFQNYYCRCRFGRGHYLAFKSL